jgi:hypothetical protein
VKERREEIHLLEIFFPATEGTARALTSYKNYYDLTDWTTRHLNAKRILEQFRTDEEGKEKTGDQLYEARR